jgi:hypothetical protein
MRSGEHTIEGSMRDIDDDPNTSWDRDTADVILLH